MADYISQITLPNGSTYNLKDSAALPLSGGDMTGNINRYYSSSSNEPMLKLTANNKNALLFQIGHGTSAGTVSGNYYKLKYTGEGNTPKNYLQLIAAVSSSTEEVAIQIDENGTVTLPQMAAGSATKPIYINSNGVITEGTQIGASAYHADSYFALASHGDHVPTTQTANNITFLRNDNSWFKLTKTEVNTLVSLLDIDNVDISDDDYIIAQYNGEGSTVKKPASKVINSTLVKAALGTNATHNEQYLRKDGTWQTVQGGVSSVAELTGDITAAALIDELGLSKALRFVGKTTSTMSEDFTGVPAGITNYTTPALGDVVLDKDDNYEYVCIAINNTNNTYTWEQLGGSGSWALDDHTHGNISNAGTKISTYDGTNDAATTTDHLFLREDGKWAKPKYTTDNDYRVRQAISSTDATYPLIFSSRTTATASNNTAYVVYRNNSIYVNPSSGELHATTFYGALTGNVTGNVTGNITGDVTGNLSGNVTGNLSGNVTGNVTGDVTGNVSGTAGSWKNSVTVYTELSTSGTNSTLKGGESSAVALKVNGTLGTGNGGLGNNSFTANCLLYSSTTTKFDSTTNIYASTDAITINGTSAPANSGNFQVKGPSTMQHIYVQTDGTYDIGADATRFRSVYLTTSLMVGAKNTIASYDSNAEGSFIGQATISVCNKDSAAGGYYLMANAVQQAKMYINTIGTTSSTGSTYLELGNNKTSTQINNSQGIIRLYSSDAVYTEIQPQITTNTSNVKTSKIFYLPQYSGSDDMYAIHAGSNSAVGSSTQQVYVAANGRITASDSTVGDSYAPTYLNDGETQITFPVQYRSFTIASGTTSVTLESSAYNQQISDMDVFVLAIVITSGEEYLNAPITWDTQQKANSTTIGQVILSTSTATSDDVTGYILTARGCEAPSDSSV